MIHIIMNPTTMCNDRLLAFYYWFPSHTHFALKLTSSNETLLIAYICHYVHHHKRPEQNVKFLSLKFLSTVLGVTCFRTSKYGANNYSRCITFSKLTAIIVSVDVKCSVVSLDWRNKVYTRKERYMYKSTDE